MRTFGGCVPDWRKAAGFYRSRVGLINAAVAVALFLVLAGQLWLPARKTVRSTLKVLHTNSIVAVKGTAHGCGNYWDTRRVGYGIGATIQLAAGFCWNGKRVWWTWGLHKNDCAPISYVFTQVRMTCDIRSGGRQFMTITYRAQVASSFIPFVTQTVQLVVIVIPDGYRVDVPS